MNKQINWLTILWGTILQFIFALIVLRWQAGYTAFQWLGDRVTEFYAYVQAGASFVFGQNYTSVYFAFAVSNV
jgi:nucleoside permease NupC